MYPKPQEQIKNPQKNASSDTLSNETIKLVESFYADDSKTQEKQDVLTVRDVNNRREKIRKRLLLDNKSNLFKKN